jgi:PAS domain S-box-containing protein
MATLRESSSTSAPAHDNSALQGEAAFRLLVEAVTDYAIFLIDPTGRVLTWNRGAERIKGYRATEIIGQHFSRFYTDEDRAAGRPMSLLAIAARDGHVEDEGWRVRKDGSRFWANILISPLRDEHGETYAFAKVTRDLTERRAAEEHDRQLLVERTARVAAEEALKARDRFLSIASHELKTPVASLRLTIDSLLRARAAGRLDQPTLEARLGRLARAAGRLASLVDELLNVSRLTNESAELTLTPTDVTDLTGEVIARFRDAGEARIRLNAAGPAVIPADPSRLDQVLTNLIDNALKYSTPPAEVIVAISDREDGVEVEVSDEGIGLDIPDDRVFHAFGRGANVETVQGMGLGLFIARRIVQRHGGRIAVGTREGGSGTTAKVWLPRPGGPS